MSLFTSYDLQRRILQFDRKEDLGLYQNQLNYMQTAWTVGYVVGEIPSNIILTKVRPRIWIPLMEVRLLEHANRVTDVAKLAYTTDSLGSLNYDPIPMQLC